VNDPFEMLGLRADADLTDDEVRAAWRRVAAATHPDRADGGDPERFARAAAAYTDLRTAHLRNEARAARTEAAQRRLAGQARGSRLSGRAAARPLSWDAVRLRPGRPLRLLAKVLAAVAAATVVVLVAGTGPAGPALIVGIATWLVLTARRDLGRG
jgi:hypothetical protein